jgi:hypothetical protein
LLLLFGRKVTAFSTGVTAMARHLIKSDTAIRTAKPDVTSRLKDGDGLYLLLKPNGSHWWRLDYSIGGKRKTLSLGTYPDTGLKAARDKASEARQQVATGIDPSDLRKASKAEQAKALEADKRIASGQPAVGSFEEVAREWFAKFSPGWAASHSSKIIRRLECDVFPWLGKRPIADIEAMEVLGCCAELRRVVQWIQRTVRTRIAGRYSAMPLRRGEPGATPARICVVHCPP